MGQGFAYARENNGTKEVIVKDSTGKEITMSAFSGYLAFSGNLLKEGLSHADAVVKGTLLGKVYSIVDGVVSGVFDAQGNPDKSMNDIIGTAATAILVGEAGAGLGSLFGPVGTVIGGTLGGIAGAIWGEDAYNGIIDIASKAMGLADQATNFINGVVDNKATIPSNGSLPIYYNPFSYINSDYNIGSSFPLYDPSFTDYYNRLNDWYNYLDNGNSLDFGLNSNNSNDNSDLDKSIEDYNKKCGSKSTAKDDDEIEEIVKNTSEDEWDPLVLDLNGDNKIDIISLANSKAHFDHANDGEAEKTSWIGKDDGFLVLDKNGNNKIDNGNELFGNFTLNQTTNLQKTA